MMKMVTKTTPSVVRRTVARLRLRARRSGRMKSLLEERGSPAAKLASLCMRPDGASQRRLRTRER